MSSISFILAYVDEESDMILYMGTDNDVDADWDKGIFKDNFRGIWGAIDDHIVYVELTEVRNNTLDSDPVWFDVTDGEISILTE